jgi:Zn-dependent protease with chaperone function
MSSSLYPQSPNLPNYDFIDPTPAFKKSVTNVILSMIFFFLLYLVLVAFSIGLLIGCVFGAIALITINVGFITLILGAGLVALGLMFFIFLIKFIFTSFKDQNPSRVQIIEKDYPELFSFIRALSEDTKTIFPKKIFISPDVNACVFYNSSFWSLFFPVRKNLDIGLGLVNSVNISELKSIIAHEFGHFSQRSMKIGSYTYIVNRAIFNMVYEYDGWDDLLAKWAGTGGIFGFFAGITFWLAERVRDVLKAAYNLINKNYMALSREMEYNADLVAVSVSGNTTFIDALRKIEFSAYAYEFTIAHLNTLADKHKSSANIYNDHQFATQYLANKFGLANDNGHIIISDDDIEKNMLKTRVIIKDQWASHPSLKEREINLTKVEVKCKLTTDSAWKLFQNYEQLQKSTSQTLYRIAFPESDFETLNKNEFELEIISQSEKYHISEIYNEFYDGRYLTEFGIKETLNTQLPTEDFDEAYLKEHVEVIKRLQLNKDDLEVLSMIKSGELDTKYFDFDGVKYQKKEISTIIKQLSQEIASEEEMVENLDKKAFLSNVGIAKKAGVESILVEYYQRLFISQKTLKAIAEIAIKNQTLTNKLYSQVRWQDDEFQILLRELTNFEIEFKKFINANDFTHLYHHIDNNEQRNALKAYKDKDQSHMKLVTFEEDSFINLSNLVYLVHSIFGSDYGLVIKELTDFQLTNLAGKR